MGQFLCGSVDHGSLPVAHCLLCGRVTDGENSEAESTDEDEVTHKHGRGNLSCFSEYFTK